MKSDLDLVQEVLNGERKSFDILTARHEDYIFRIVTRITKDPEVSRDIIQDTLVKAFTRLHTFNGDTGQFRGWLRVIALNTARNNYRAEKLREGEGVVPAETIPDPNTPETLLMSGMSAQVHRAIERLPDKQRMMVEMVIFKGYRIVDVARERGIAYNTAKANYRHALKNLKFFLSS